jgi:hypothetical protein
MVALLDGAEREHASPTPRTVASLVELATSPGSRRPRSGPPGWLGRSPPAPGLTADLQGPSMASRPVKEVAVAEGNEPDPPPPKDLNLGLLLLLGGLFMLFVLLAGLFGLTP